MEAGIQQRLTSDAGVSVLVGSRIYPLILPEAPIVPAITYQRISTVRDYTTTGAVSLTRIRLQIDCWATTYAQVKAIDNATRSALETFSGQLPDGTHVESVTLDTSHDLYEDTGRYYRVSSDYIFFAVL